MPLTLGTRYNSNTMVRELKPDLNGHGLKVGLIVSQFNEFITVRLLKGARDALTHHQVLEQDVGIVWVPGSLELPQAAQRMAASGHWDALVVLGSVIKGETAHFELVVAETARGVSKVALQSGVPVGFGVLSTYDSEQAVDRAGGKLGNRGYDAAVAAIQMANLFRAQDAKDPSFFSRAT